MRAWRSIVVCCLLLALPVQLLAAFAPCCPADTAGAHDAAHAGMSHAAPDASPAEAGHPCDEGANATGPRDDCDAGRCAMHCAHASALSGQPMIRALLARSGPPFPAPIVGVDGIALSPRLRPPISVHC